jgi:O-succinylbenzoic acid--CoA ligase
VSKLSIFAAAREAPDRLALIVGTARYTFSELAARTRARAAVLAASRSPLLLQPLLDLDSLLWLYAASATGTPFFPLHAGTPRSEQADLQTRSGARKPPAAPADGAACFDELPVDPEQAFALLRTSGSSATPKIVILSRRAVLASAAASEGNLGSAADERWLLCLPLSHVAGLSIAVRMLAARRTVVLLEPATAGLLDRVTDLCCAIRDQRVTLLSLVPTVLERLLQSGFAPPASLRAVLLGGAGCPIALAELAYRAGVPLLTSYGLTETGSQVVARPYADRHAPLAQHRDSVSSGHALQGVELRIDGGLIAIRTPALLSRYLDSATPALDGDGWLLTNDHGALGPNGELFVLGRSDLVIVTGGEKVNPEEVECALRTVPGILDACVCGRPCTEFGQQVVAVVVTPVGKAPLQLQELQTRLAPKLTRFQMPRALVSAAALPQTASGKLDRRACAALFSAP